jgi:hypothetical protein
MKLAINQMRAGHSDGAPLKWSQSHVTEGRAAAP